MARRGLIIGSLALIILGIVLLLNNFLLISSFNVASLLPLLLVLFGALILLRGDLLPGKDAKSFGITRGSVENGILEISAGAIDVSIQALQREGRLIAGEYAFDSRPQLNVQQNQAHLKLERSATPWLSFANWDMAVARDLPWSVYVSASLGQVKVDSSSLIVQNAIIGTGFGSIRFTCPPEAFAPIRLRSTLGNIQVLTPNGYRAKIFVRGSRVFGVYADEERYEQDGDNIYYSREPSPNRPEVEIHVSGTFGDLYLA